MDFMIDQVYAAGGDDVARAYASPELYERLVGLPKLSTPEVLDHRVDGTTVRLQLRYRFIGDLSPAVTAVVDRDKLTWVEHSEHDLAKRTVRYRLAPDHYADRLESSGTCVITDRTNGSVRTVTGSLKVRALIVGGAVERAIVSGLKEYLADEVALVDRFVADHAG
ncbi:MAG TPA: DUF2505 family protein [Acidimicrobiales bacterium]|nr:DUF2505 family protein [Acidimicrobiales bacterium]